MNLAAFLAMLSRDGRVARRNFLPLLLQNLVQPMLFVFVFGRVMTTSGMMPESYKSLLLPGIIAISMLLSGLQAVAFPMIVPSRVLGAGAPSNKLNIALLACGVGPGPVPGLGRGPDVSGLPATRSPTRAMLIASKPSSIPGGSR